jgi:transcriptional regulator with XRE-family HTH domain
MIYCGGNGSVQLGQSDVDREIGGRIRARREKLGLSQEQVAEEIGWFVAQVDDCENGLLRPPSRDLFLLADLLSVEVSYFYQGLERPLTSPAEPMDSAMPLIESAIGLPQELHGHAGAIELFCIYARIKDPRKQALLLDLAESFARDS